MSKPDTRRIDREIRTVSRKLTAVREREMWPLTGSERRSILAAMAAGSFSIARDKSPSRAEKRLESTWGAAEIRLTAEMTALQVERQRIVTEAAQAKAKAKAGRQSIWW